jgi:hypothetical protein
VTIIQPAQYHTETEAIPPDDGDVPAIIRAFLTSLALGESIEAGHFGEVLSCCVELRPPLRDVVLGSVMTAVMMAGPDVDAIEAILRAALSLDQPEAEPIAADGCCEAFEMSMMAAFRMMTGSRHCCGVV